MVVAAVVVVVVVVVVVGHGARSLEKEVAQNSLEEKNNSFSKCLAPIRSSQHHLLCAVAGRRAATMARAAPKVLNINMSRLWQLLAWSPKSDEYIYV